KPLEWLVGKGSTPYGQERAKPQAEPVEGQVASAYQGAQERAAERIRKEPAAGRWRVNIIACVPFAEAALFRCALLACRSRFVVLGLFDQRVEFFAGVAGKGGVFCEAEDAHALGDTEQGPARSSSVLINNDVGILEVRPIGILEVLPFVVCDAGCWNDVGCWDANGPQVIGLFLTIYDEDYAAECD